MESDKKALKLLKKRSLRWSEDRGFFIFKNFILQNLPSIIVIYIIQMRFYYSPTAARGESKKFFLWSNTAYGACKISKSRRLLRIALGVLGKSFPTSYVSLLDTSVKLNSREPHRRSSFTNSVLLATKGIPVETLDAKGWYQLSCGLFSMGYFRAAWVARENSLDLSISEYVAPHAGATKIQRGLEALFERRHYPKVSNFFAEVSIPGLFPDVRQHLSLVQNFSNEVSVDREFPSAEADEIFKNLIKDKYVVLVGPACARGEFGEEIDKADTVIRLKWTDGQKLANSKHFGSRADIIYFGGGPSISAVQLLAGQGLITSIFDGVKLILTNVPFVGQIKSVPVYVFQSAGKLYRTPSTSGLRTIMEVLKYKPQKLVLYGFDFYSTLIPYNSEMTKFYQDLSWQFGHPNDFVADGVYFKFARARDFSGHDPVSNFCFAQNLYKAGLFEIEPYGKSILELTPYQYVERLEEMLGDW